MPSSAAEVAEPENHCRPTIWLAKITVSTTPETYSGVEVVAIATVESTRSCAEPSRMPASTPRSSAPGTITTITQNISLAVSQSRGQSTSATGALKRVEWPKSPRTTPPSHSP